jgi:hypothetical protein
MPSDRVALFLAAKKFLRLHPDWDDERIAETIGCPRVLIPDVVVVARQEIETAG